MSSRFTFTVAKDPHGQAADDRHTVEYFLDGKQVSREDWLALSQVDVDSTPPLEVAGEAIPDAVDETCKNELVARVTISRRGGSKLISLDHDALTEFGWTSDGHPDRDLVDINAVGARSHLRGFRFVPIGARRGDVTVPPHAACHACGYEGDLLVHDTADNGSTRWACLNRESCRLSVIARHRGRADHIVTAAILPGQLCSCAGTAAGNASGRHLLGCQYNPHTEEVPVSHMTDDTSGLALCGVTESKAVMGGADHSTCVPCLRTAINRSERQRENPDRPTPATSSRASDPEEHVPAPPQARCDICGCIAPDLLQQDVATDGTVRWACIDGRQCTLRCVAREQGATYARAPVLPGQLCSCSLGSLANHLLGCKYHPGHPGTAVHIPDGPGGDTVLCGSLSGLLSGRSGMFAPNCVKCLRMAIESRPGQRSKLLSVRGPEAAADELEGREFYELMQTYRFPTHDQPKVVAAFEAVKAFIRKHRPWFVPVTPEPLQHVTVPPHAACHACGYEGDLLVHDTADNGSTRWACLNRESCRLSVIARHRGRADHAGTVKILPGQICDCAQTMAGAASGRHLLGCKYNPVSSPATLHMTGDDGKALCGAEAGEIATGGADQSTCVPCLRKAVNRSERRRETLSNRTVFYSNYITRLENASPIHIEHPEQWGQCTPCHRLVPTARAGQPCPVCRTTLVASSSALIAALRKDGDLPDMGAPPPAEAEPDEPVDAQRVVTRLLTYRWIGDGKCMLCGGTGGGPPSTADVEAAAFAKRPWATVGAHSAGCPWRLAVEWRKQRDEDESVLSLDPVVDGVCTMCDASGGHNGRCPWLIAYERRAQRLPTKKE